MPDVLKDRMLDHFVNVPLDRVPTFLISLVARRYQEKIRMNPQCLDELTQEKQDALVSWIHQGLLPQPKRDIPETNRAINEWIRYTSLPTVLRRVLLLHSEPEASTAVQTSGTKSQRYTKKMTVVVVDLADSTEKARALEEHLDDPEVVKQFHEKIRDLLEQALERVRFSRQQILNKETGDGAILVFADATIAHRFAVALHEATKARNARKGIEAAKWAFRIGVATGNLAVDGTTFDGMAVTDATRLESIGQDVHVLIDQATYDAFPNELKSLYSGPETVTAKKETLQVYRYVAFPVSNT